MSQAFSPAVLDADVVSRESLGSVPESASRTTSEGTNTTTGSLFEIRVATTASAEEFSYRPLTPLAPITLFFAICSASAYFDWYGVAIGGVGLLVGMFTLWRIWHSSGELTGWALASTGTVLSAISVVGGASWHIYQYQTEVPAGYQRVNFSWLSDQLPLVKDGKDQIHPEVQKLDGQDIFIKGYMYPTRQDRNLTEFVMLKDTGQCCFGGNPKLSDMIVVKLKDFTVDHREMQLVSVAGKFHAGPRSDSAGLSAVYTLDATHFK